MKKNGLKALMLTDWYTLKIVYICVIVMIVCFGGMSLCQAVEMGNIVPVLTVGGSAISTILISSSFAYDEYKNMGVMKKSMPYTYREIVLARYLPPALIAAATAVITITGALIGCAIHGSFEAGFMGQLAWSVWMSTLYTLILPTFFYPFFFTIGYRRTQVAFTIFSMIIMLGSMGIFMLSSLTVVFSDTEEEFSPELFSMPVPVGAILTAVTAGLYYLSYRVTVKKYAESDN